jgi:hypothetical protein
LRRKIGIAKARSHSRFHKSEKRDRDGEMRDRKIPIIAQSRERKKRDRNHKIMSAIGSAIVARSRDRKNRDRNHKSTSAIAIAKERLHLRDCASESQKHERDHDAIAITKARLRDLDWEKR